MDFVGRDMTGVLHSSIVSDTYTAGASIFSSPNTHCNVDTLEKCKP